MGALYDGPLYPLESVGGICEHCEHEDGGHYGDCSTVHKTILPSAPDAQQAAEAIADVFREAGMPREINDPND